MITKEEALASIFRACTNRIERIEQQLSAVQDNENPCTYLVQVGTLYVRESGEEIFLVGPEDATRYTNRERASHKAAAIRNGNGERGAVVETIIALIFEIRAVAKGLEQTQAMFWGLDDYWTDTDEMNSYA